LILVTPDVGCTVTRPVRIEGCHIDVAAPKNAAVSGGECACAKAA
jgi:hypothetical protein